MVCCECGNDYLTGKDLSNHIKKEHKMSGIDYAVKHVYAGKRPMFSSCGEETRYTAFQFKKYCSNCTLIATKEGGARGGKSEIEIASERKCNKITGVGSHNFTLDP
jgi:hypothetical protein